MVFALIINAEVLRHLRTFLKQEIPDVQEEITWINMMLSVWRLP